MPPHDTARLSRRFPPDKPHVRRIREHTQRVKRERERESGRGSEWVHTRAEGRATGHTTSRATPRNTTRSHTLFCAAKRAGGENVHARHERANARRRLVAQTEVTPTHNTPTLSARARSRVFVVGRRRHTRDDNGENDRMCGRRNARYRDTSK